MRRTAAILTVVAGLGVAALTACGGDDAPEPDSAATPDAETTPEDAEPAEFAGPANQEHLLHALDLMPSEFTDAESCDDPGAEPTFGPYQDEVFPTGTEWFGKEQKNADGARPIQMWNADFCLPEKDGVRVNVYLDILGFENVDDATAWLDDLDQATASGQKVAYRGSGEGPEPECVPVAKQSDASVAGAEAIDVVTNEPCSLAKEFPDQLDWKPRTDTFAAGGPYVFAVYVQENHNIHEEEFEYDDGSFQRRVAPEKIRTRTKGQTSLTAALTDALAHEAGQ